MFDREGSPVAFENLFCGYSCMGSDEGVEAHSLNLGCLPQNRQFLLRAEPDRHRRGLLSGYSAINHGAILKPPYNHVNNYFGLIGQ